MTVKIFIKRYMKSDRIEEALSVLKQFRSAALDQPGYISGETLIGHYDPRSVVVVSTWQTVEDWIRWQESGERARNEAQLEALLGQPTKYEIYNVGVSPSNSDMLSDAKAQRLHGC
ncbi:MAG: antibiotic biosynthesis monooxygenase [Desulfosarcinaceae bacterium]|jgi:pentatricopeptide repeat protein